MMMKDDKKKVASVIIAKINGSNREKPQSEGAEIADSDDKDIAADEIMEAIKKSDVKALKEALKSFVEMCSYEEESKDDSEEEYE
jgi:hypothetical protein